MYIDLTLKLDTFGLKTGTNTGLIADDCYAHFFKYSHIAKGDYLFLISIMYKQQRGDLVCL